MQPLIMSTAEQGSQEWLNDRATVVTSSMFKTVCAKGRGNTPSKTRATYMRTLANAIVTGNPAQEGFKSADMEEGNRREPESRDYYAMVSRNKVTQAGLIYLNELKRIGASVDGLINDDGNLELKNPKLDTHLLYLDEGVVPVAYKHQIQGQLWVTGREYCDFVSYHPDAYKMMFRKRVERDDAFIKTIETEVYKFIGELDLMVARWAA